MNRFATMFAAALLTAHAAPPAAQSGGAPSLQLVQQKEAFAARLLADAASLERIAASGHAEAAQLLERARNDYRKALAALQAGELPSANVLLNEVIAAMARTRHLVPDPAARAREEGARHARLMSSVESLRESYREHLSHLGREVQGDAAWRAVSQLLEQARELAAAQRVAEANRRLLQAESVQLDAFGPMLAGKTLDYTPHFSDPADEFRFELERNRDYDALVPLAIAELNPTKSARELAERYVASGLELRRTALRRAATGDYSGALASIRAGTVYLQRALVAAGLTVLEEDGT